MKIVIIFTLLSGVFAAPFMKEEEAKRFIRLKRQSGYWDPNHSQNQWGYTIQEQANEYWTALRTDAQYYMDMGHLMFDRSVAIENNRLYMEMLRNARAHLDSHTVTMVNRGAVEMLSSHSLMDHIISTSQ